MMMQFGLHQIAYFPFDTYNRSIPIVSLFSWKKILNLLSFRATMIVKLSKETHKYE